MNYKFCIFDELFLISVCVKKEKLYGHELLNKQDGLNDLMIRWLSLGWRQIYYFLDIDDNIE